MIALEQKLCPLNRSACRLTPDMQGRTAEREIRKASSCGHSPASGYTGTRTLCYSFKMVSVTQARLVQRYNIFPQEPPCEAEK